MPRQKYGNASSFNKTKTPTVQYREVTPIDIEKNAMRKSLNPKLVKSKRHGESNEKYSIKA